MLLKYEFCETSSHYYLSFFAFFLSSYSRSRSQSESCSVSSSDSKDDEESSMRLLILSVVSSEKECLNYSHTRKSLVPIFDFLSLTFCFFNRLCFFFCDSVRDRKRTMSRPFRSLILMEKVASGCVQESLILFLLPVCVDLSQTTISSVPVYGSYYIPICSACITFVTFLRSNEHKGSCYLTLHSRQESCTSKEILRQSFLNFLPKNTNHVYPGQIFSVK